MAEYDSLLRYRDAALRCNEGAKNGAGIFQDPSAVNWRGNWINELEEAVPAFSEAARGVQAGAEFVAPAEVPFRVIERAAMQLCMEPVQIGPHSFHSAHSAAEHRAWMVLQCLRGQRSELPDGAERDLRGRIQQEFLRAVEREPAPPNQFQAAGASCIVDEASAAAGEGQQAEQPRPTYLTSWREIVVTVLKRYDNENVAKVKSLNKAYNGPIKPGSKGKQPFVNKASLIEWWDRLDAMVQTENRSRDAAASAAATHAYGRNGDVAPDLAGSVKKRRVDRKHSKTSKT